MITTTANPKGGSGKTTFTISASVGMAKRGHSVLAIDCDPELYLTQWKNDRQQQIDAGADIVNFPVYTALTAKDLIKILAANEDKVDFIFIDTPGFDSGVNRIALASSAVAIFTSKPGGLDKKSIPKIAQLSQMMTAENPILQCYLFGCDLSNHHVTIKEDIAFLQGITDEIPALNLFPAYNQNRVAYGRCSTVGLGPQEMGDKNVAQEIDDLLDGLLAVEAAIIDALEATPAEAQIEA